MPIVSTGRTISTTEYVTKKRKERRKVYTVAAISTFFLLLAIVLILRLPALQIASVAVDGAVATSPSDIQSEAKSFLSGSYLWLIPKTNAFFYPHNGLEADLMHRFPRMSSVAISLQGVHSLRIEGVERKPFALYCGGAATSSSCYFLDDTGYIFDTAPVFSDGVYFVYMSDPALENPLRSQFLTEPRFAALTSFVEKLRLLGADPHSLTVRSADVSIALGTGATVLIGADADPGALSSTLESFLANDEIRGEKDFWSRIASLDMRTENKVFYTFRE